MFRARRLRRRRATARSAEIGGAAQGDEKEEHVSEPEPAPALDSAEQIKDLHELREQGILTEEEFVAEKKKLLGP